MFFSQLLMKESIRMIINTLKTKLKKMKLESMSKRPLTAITYICDNYNFRSHDIRSILYGDLILLQLKNTKKGIVLVTDADNARLSEIPLKDFLFNIDDYTELLRMSHDRLEKKLSDGDYIDNRISYLLKYLRLHQRPHRHKCVKIDKSNVGGHIYRITLTYIDMTTFSFNLNMRLSTFQLLKEITNVREVINKY